MEGDPRSFHVGHTGRYDVGPPVPQADWVTKKDRQVRTSELLLSGTLLGMCGLFLSLVLCLYRSQCDTDEYMPVRVRLDGRMQVCRSSCSNAEVRNPPWANRTEGVWDELNTRLVSIPGTSCHADAHCPEGSTCLGRRGGLKERDYCAANACECHEFVHECGTHRTFEFTVAPSEVLQDCRAPTLLERCSTRQTFQINYWKDPGYTGHLTNLGCESHQKNTLLSSMKWIENHMESLGFSSPLKPDSDPVWGPIRDELATTPDLEYNWFWPSTISESVSAQGSPASKIFLGFMLLASMCLLASNYTYECKTVDLGNKATPCIRVQVNTIRQLLPPIGLTLLAIVSMKPTESIFSLCDALMTIVHLCGAQFCFVIFLFTEALSLIDADNADEMTSAEFTLRCVITVIGSIAMATFGGVYVILSLFSGGSQNPHVDPPFTGMSDMYDMDPTMRMSYLARPAEGMWQVLKVISYSAEFTVALALLADLLVVWFFYHNDIQAQRNEDAAESDGESSEGGVC